MPRSSGDAAVPPDYRPHGVTWNANREGKVAIFRFFKHGSRSYIKIKGQLGWDLFLGMTDCEESRNGEVRRGPQLLASIENIIDGPVAELRLSNATRDFANYAEGFFELKHSLAMNRKKGQAVMTGDVIKIRGKAAEALADYLGRSGSVVELEVTDLAKGEVKIR